MSFVNSIWTDLRERHLWPVALVLLAAVVAVPVLLSRTAPSASWLAAKPTAPSVSAPAGTALPAVSVVAVHDRHLQGHQRNPFAQQRVHIAGAGENTGANGTNPVTSNSSKGTQPRSSGGGGGTGTTTTPNGGARTTRPSERPTPSETPTPTPTPETALLSRTEAYHVALSVTNSSDGVNAVDPFQRLSALPDSSNPLLLQLGVLRGGKRVLFLLEPGTTVRGSASCISGPLDCEILSLAPNETITASGKAGDGSKISVEFAVTAIHVAHYGSAGAATRARRKVSRAGQRLLRQSSAPALSLFRYRTWLGAVADLRNLSEGGN